MEAISERMAVTVPLTKPAGTVREASAMEPAGERGQSPAPQPPGDYYAPEEKPEPIGLYRVEQDGEGSPKVHFDAPRREKEAGEGAPAEPERKEKDDTTTCDTGRVDREIQQLKKKQEELKKRLDHETDAEKLRELEKQLAQLESELCQKDNDAYRRQNAVYS